MLSLHQSDRDDNDPDNGDGKGGRWQKHDEKRGDNDGGEADAEDWPVGRGHLAGGRAERRSFRKSDDAGGHDESDKRRKPHVAEELPAGELEMAQDDQVGEVRAR